MSYTTVKALFRAICDAIRAKENSTGDIEHQDIPERISNLNTDLERFLLYDDDKSRMLVDVPAGLFQFAGYNNNNRNLLIDWGDGTTSTTPDSAFSGTFQHTYAKAGKYLITIESLGDYSGSIYCFSPILRWDMDIPYTEGRNSLIGLCMGRNSYAANNVSVQNRHDIRTLVIYSNSAISSFGDNFLVNNCYSLRKLVIDAEMNTNAKMLKLQNCESLLAVRVPEVGTIPTMAFYNNYSLRDVYIPECVTAIQTSAFEQCYMLKTIVLPESLQTLARAFNQCTKLETVVVTREDGVITADGNLFELNTKIAKGTGYIYVPDALVADYQAATNWSNYAAQIKGWSEAPQEVQDILVERGHEL